MNPESLNLLLRALQHSELSDEARALIVDVVSGVSSPEILDRALAVPYTGPLSNYVKWFVYYGVQNIYYGVKNHSQSDVFFNQFKEDIETFLANEPSFHQ